MIMHGISSVRRLLPCIHFSGMLSYVPLATVKLKKLLGRCQAMEFPGVIDIWMDLAFIRSVSLLTMDLRS